MKILIACDMEGVNGVTTFDQVTPGHAEWERFRRMMTTEINQAIRGCLHAGVDEIIVCDGHWNGTNILIEELDPKARLISGTGSPLSMVQGVESGVNGVLFLGYHARRGSQNAILDHTWSSTRVANLWLNGRLAGEIALNAAVAGHFNVPVLMISGDQTACAEAAQTIPGIETAVVKRALGRTIAECLPIEAAHQRIREAAGRAVARLRIDSGLQPFQIEPPVLVAIEFITAEMADKAALMSGACRIDGQRVQFTAEDMVDAYRMFRAAVGLAQV